MYKTDHGHNGFTIKAFIISLMNNSQAQYTTRNLLHSINVTKSEVQPFIVPATTPETTEFDIKTNFSREYINTLYDQTGKIRYTWPKSPAEDGIDFSTGIYKRAYAAADWRKVLACSISHMKLWQHCIDLNEPILILEHDAYFIHTFKYIKIGMSGKDYENNKNNNSPKYGMASIGEWSGGICGINDPTGATRKSAIFDFKLKNSLETQYEKQRDFSGLARMPYFSGLARVPCVDEPGDIPLPSGLPGNSAYIIKPWAAKKLLEKTSEIGIWPNDALICRQFFPWLQHYLPYFTKVQGSASTTTK
jgi:GR25 family glycosyltransferase involved in LPS biosynthesis